jgi:hypothetical protein
VSPGADYRKGEGDVNLNTGKPWSEMDLADMREFADKMTTKKLADREVKQSGRSRSVVRRTGLRMPGGANRRGG